MRNRGFSFLGVLNGITLVGIGAILWVLWKDAHEASEAPVVVHEVWFDPDVVERGRVASLFIDRTRVRFCPGNVYEWWSHESGNIFQGQVVAAGASPKLGRSVVKFSKYVPPEIGAGKVCYSPVIVYQCGKTTHLVHQPTACLVLVESK